MVPSETYEKCASAIARAKREHRGDDYIITGTDLRDLAVLVDRLNYRIDGEACREWQNRISLMVQSAKEITLATLDQKLSEFP